MNLHVVQGEQPRAEVALLMSVPTQIVSPQSNRPIIGMVQDGLVGAYLLTRRDTFLKRGDVMQLVMQMNKGLHGSVEDLIQSPAVMWRVGDKWKRRWTGKQVVSLLLPNEFNLERYVRNGSADQERGQDGSGRAFCLDERHVIIRRGELMAGSLCKQTVGSTGGGIIHLLCNDYNSNVSAEFLNDMQRVVNLWLTSYGFSARYSDCLVDKDSENIMQAIMSKAFEKVEQVETNPLLPFHMKENCAQKVLASVRDLAGGLVATKMAPNNGFLNMSTSGSKGSNVNIAQISGVVAQQSVNGRRIGVDSERRALSYFPKDTTALHPIHRGFVTHSFIQGLTPREFFFHAMGGREGLIDTSCKSVARDTRILIQDAGVTKVVEIGDWIDACMAATPFHITKDEHDMETLQLGHQVYIPTVDASGKSSWGLLTAVTRHPPGPKLYEVKTRGGRSVVVTASHSLLVWNVESQQFESRKPEDTRVGDLLPVTDSTCSTKIKDVYLEAIESLTPITPDPILHSFMYDVTVPSTFNFGLANGLYVRDTADTGYIQRRLTKAMESLKVRQDGTVRNAQDYIVEFSYGADHFDASKVEPVKLPIVKMSNEQVKTAFLLPDSMINQNPTWKQVCQTELDELLQIRDRLRQSLRHPLMTTLENTVYVSVNLQRLVESVKTLKLPNEPNYLLTPFTVHTLVQMCCDQILSKGELETFYLRSYIKTTLCIKHCIMTFKLSPAELDWVLNTVQHKYMQTLVSPGEMVGTIAASSIGEPCTQMSVAPGTLIYVRETRTWPSSGRIMTAVDLVTIETFVKQVISDSTEVTVKDDTTNASTKVQPDDTDAECEIKYETLSVSTRGKVEWKPVTGVTEHPPNGDMLQVKTCYGRSVTATLAKSWLIQGNDNEVVPVDGSAIQVGTRLPLLRHLELDPDDTDPDTPVQLYIGHVYLFLDDDFPRGLDINAELGFLFGMYYCKTFHAAGSYIQCAHPSDDCVERVKTYCIDTLKIADNHSVEGSYTCISRSLVKMLYFYCGKKWQPEFHLPDFLYNHKEFLLGFVDGLFCASMVDTKWDSKTGLVLKPLWEDDTDIYHDLIFLLASLSVVPRITDKKWVEISGRELYRLHKQVHFTWPLLQKQVEDYCSTHIHATHSPQDTPQDSPQDVMWDPIESVTRITPDYPYVYDLTVEDNPTFVVGDGIFMMDTLNSKFLY